MVETPTTPCKYFKPISEDNQKDGLCLLHPPEQETNINTGHRFTKVSKPCWCGDYKADEQQ